MADISGRAISGIEALAPGLEVIIERLRKSDSPGRSAKREPSPVVQVR